MTRLSDPSVKPEFFSSTEPLKDGFAVSRLYKLRRSVAKAPFRFLIFLVPVVVMWTLLMSVGAAMHGSNLFAIQFSPHIAHYTIIIGMIIYPARLFWVPVVVFIFVFLLPIFLPMSGMEHWRELVVTAPWVLVFFLIINIVSAVITGLVAMRTLQRAKTRLSAYAADMTMVLVTQAGFLAMNLAMIATFYTYMANLSPDLQSLMGFDDNFLSLAVKRTLRGCTVLLVFFLAVLQKAELKDAQYVAPTLAIYFCLAILHLEGYGGFQPMDAILVAIALCFVLPPRIAPLAQATGFALYSGMTGNFLKDIIPSDARDNLMDYYAIILLAFVGYFLSYRGFVEHREQTSKASIRRLDAARDFAGVGIFVVNQNQAIIQLDRTGQRMFSLEHPFIPIFELFERFEPDAQAKLATLGIVEPGQTAELVLHVRGRREEIRILRILVWAERSESGAKLAYGLVMDVTVQAAQREDLEKALAVLEEKDERQRRMFSIISHEIRTPASVMSMLIEDLGEDTVAKLQPKLKEASHQLLGVLSDMRQAVNPEQNLAVVKKPYKPSELADTVRNTYQDQASKYKMTIGVTLGRNAHMSRVGDSARLKQLIGNLVRNAIIHSRGRKIDIGFDCVRDEDDNPWSVWTVKDDGIGIAPEQVERLFEPFERGGNDPRNQADGSGLGLYIAKTAVELLGGTIEYIQQPRGACYMISVPEDVSNDADEVAAVRKTADPARLSRMDVLLVEDNALVADVTKARLEKIFRSVTLARTGVEAMYALSNATPDLLVTDLFMPEMEGDVLIKTLIERGHTFPMIGLTAAAVGNDMERFHEAGASLVLSKPMDMEMLLAHLAEVEDA